MKNQKKGERVASHAKKYLGQTLGGRNRVAVKVRAAMRSQPVEDRPDNHTYDRDSRRTGDQSIIVTSVVM